MCCFLPCVLVKIFLALSLLLLQLQGHFLREAFSDHSLQTGPQLFYHTSQLSPTHPSPSCHWAENYITFAPKIDLFPFTLSSIFTTPARHPRSGGTRMQYRYLRRFSDNAFETNKVDVIFEEIKKLNLKKPLSKPLKFYFNVSILVYVLKYNKYIF